MRKQLVAVVLALTTVGLASAHAGELPDRERASSASPLRVAASLNAPAAVRDYWTAERMRRARPFHPSPPAEAVLATEDTPDDGAGRVPESAPEPSAASSKTPGDGALLPATLSSYDVPGAYTTFPNSTNGKVFFHNPVDGYEYVCSATALTSDNHSVVWTAGHCVVDPAKDKYFTNWVFVPAYRDGSAPLGVWPALEMWALDAWIQRTDYGYDVAAVVVAPNASGKRLTDVTGGRGFAWNLSKEQTFEAIGYPARPPFGGGRMIACLSPLYGEGLLGESSIGIECDMTPGSSGGGWIVQDQYLNSNTSYGYVELPGVLYGPYLGDAASNLYGKASESEAPGPDPDADPAPVDHARSLTLKLKKHLVAKGRLTARDGYLLCSDNSLVRIERKGSSGWKKVAKTRAAADGSYKTKLDDRKGKYRSVSPATEIDDANGCGEAISPVRTH